MPGGPGGAHHAQGLLHQDSGGCTVRPGRVFVVSAGVFL